MKHQAEAEVDAGAAAGSDREAVTSRTAMDWLSRPLTAAECREAVVSLEAEAAEAQQAARAKEAERDRVLLSAGDAEAEAFDTELARLKRTADRCSAALAKFRDKLAATERSEGYAAAAALHREVDKARSIGLELIEAYGQQAAALVKTLWQLKAIDQFIARAARRLAAAADGNDAVPADWSHQLTPNQIARFRSGTDPRGMVSLSPLYHEGEVKLAAATTNREGLPIWPVPLSYRETEQPFLDAALEELGILEDPPAVPEATAEEPGP